MCIDADKKTRKMTIRHYADQRFKCDYQKGKVIVTKNDDDVVVNISVYPFGWQVNEEYPLEGKHIHNTSKMLI